MMNIFQSLFLSFLLTLALELPVFILWGGRGKKDLLLLVLVNLLTNPGTVALYLYLRSVLPLRPLSLQLLLEIPVVLAESGLYRKYGRELRHPFLLSLTANSFSYGIGLMLQSILLTF